MKHFYNVPTLDQQKEFYNIFKKPLNFFYDDITGFDLIKLDVHVREARDFFGGDHA